MAGAADKKSPGSEPGGREAPAKVSHEWQAVKLTFFCTTSCQLMLRKNLCSITSLASLGPPPSLGRDGHEHPPPRTPSLGDRFSVQVLNDL